jgi:hypothetical protein
MLINRCFVLIALLGLAGCPMKNSDPEPDGAAGAGGAAGEGGVAGAAAEGGAAGQTGTAGAAGETPKLSPDAAVGNPGKPLAVACAANSECASGFCVDSVCCNTACDGQCTICNPPGALGYCTGQISGDDTTSVETCTGAHTCSIAIPVLNIQACRLKDLQACKVNLDCASLNCVTFYVDHDGAGYGDTAKTIQFCEEQGAAPPVGYVAQGGDCCDSDANAYPGQTQFFTAANGCGSFDFNCDGTVQGTTNSLFGSVSTVPASECGTTVNSSTGCRESCTATVSCH